MSTRTLLVEASVKQLVTSRQAWHYRMVPIQCEDGTLKVDMDQSLHINGIASELEVVLGKPVRITPRDASHMEEALQRNYPKNGQDTGVSNLPKMLSDKENFILTLIEEAMMAGSSDIHFEIQERKARVRYRVDGHLVDKYEIPLKEYPAVINAIKIKSSLDIAEKRLPQDGRICFNRNGKRVDIRVSIVPTIHGEKVVFRLLNKDTAHLSIDSVGFSPAQLESYRNGFLRSHGLVLVSGPTG